MQTITILGATGSIGQSTAKVLRENPGAFRVRTLVAQRDALSLAALAREFSAECAVVADADALPALREALHGTGIHAAGGQVAMLDACTMPVDIVVAGIVGMAGLTPILHALPHCHTLALANKEAIVCAGSLVLRTAAHHNVTIQPVDSEHNAIAQILHTAHRPQLRFITLTASGGPFRSLPLAALATVTPEQATAHPTWQMGQKISVDSATMMNKGLEVLEACHLFGLDEADVRVVMHPQSVIHGLVQYADGSVLAQMGAPDMATPIAYALGATRGIRYPLSVPALDLIALGSLSFFPVEHERFPCLNLARQAWRYDVSAADNAAGGSAAITLNAANEIAVAAFLQRQIPLPRIAECVDAALQRPLPPAPRCLEDILAIDEQTRTYMAEQMQLIAA